MFITIQLNFVFEWQKIHKVPVLITQCLPIVIDSLSWIGPVFTQLLTLVGDWSSLILFLSNKDILFYDNFAPSIFCMYEFFHPEQSPNTFWCLTYTTLDHIWAMANSLADRRQLKYTLNHGSCVSVSRSSILNSPKSSNKLLCKE